MQENLKLIPKFREVKKSFYLKSLPIKAMQAKEQHFKIKLISPKEVLAVRHPVLREGKPIEACIFDGDDLPTTFHVGLFINNNLTAVVSFMENKHLLFNEENQYQLRGMAVLKEFQFKGLGYEILRYGETILINKGIKMVWCNAREVAVNFYRKNNYTIKGDPFLIPDIGIHYVMQKILQ